MEALYFTATWCGPCKTFGPIMDRANDLIPVRKIDIEQQMELTGTYDVFSVPTVIIVNDGVEQGRRVGSQTEEALREWVESYLGA